MNTLEDEQLKTIVKGFLTVHGPATEDEIVEVIEAAEDLAIAAALFSLLTLGRIAIKGMRDGGPVFVTLKGDDA